MSKPSYDTSHPVFTAKERLAKLSNIRELVFGAQDGLLVPLGVVSSVAGAFSNNHIVLVAGISEALAGAFSMGTGAFLAYQAERQVQANAIEEEESDLKARPDNARHELTLLLQAEGLTEADAKTAANAVATSHDSFVSTLVQKKFGIDPEPENSVLWDATLIGLSYLIAAIVPLLPYFFIHGAPAIAWSIGLTLLALFGIGIGKGKVASLPYLKSGLQVLLVGGVSGLGGYGLGILLPRFLGLN
jgi:VIT1/CCC1 family predicted Fe2+/Mn2+ transporter